MRPQLLKDGGATFERRVAEIFRRAGWKVQRNQAVSDAHAGLIVQRGDCTYLVEIKSASEGRRDRLMPLLALAILQAQVFARRRPEPVVPLAIVGAKRVSESLAEEIERFVQEYAPDVAVGLLDLEGFQWFHGPGLESLSARRGRAEQRLHVRAPEIASHLFSDLNQWMLKVLLAPHIPPDLMTAPRGEYRNASQLAAAAGVSLMSAFRLMRQLRVEGFLDESASPLRLVRLDELLRRWQAANLRPAREFGVRWVLRGNPAQQIQDALREPAPAQGARSGKSSRSHAIAIRACLGLFAAADALGLGFVHGVVPHIYLERFAPSALQRLGLSLDAPTSPPDVYIRVPAVPESVFRGAVSRDGLTTSDVLQIWLDTAAHPARGQEQADMLYRRVLRPLLERGSR